MATQDEARAVALALPEAVAGSHMDRQDVRVRKKISATLPPDGSHVVKTTPASFDALVRMDPETFRKVWGERWVGIDVSRLDEGQLTELVVDAWKLAAPKTLVRAFEEGAEG